MTEANFRSWLVKNAGSGWMMQTIETSTGTGVPDVYFCTQGHQGWLELKNSALLSACYMRVSQWRWFHKLYKRGGVALLLIKRQKLKTIDIYPGSELVSETLQEARTYEIRKDDVFFPSTIKPAFTYKLGTGNKVLFDTILQLIKGEYNND